MSVSQRDLFSCFLMVHNPLDYIYKKYIYIQSYGSKHKKSRIHYINNKCTYIHADLSNFPKIKTILGLFSVVFEIASKMI